VEGSNAWPNLRYYIGICLEGLRNAKKHLSQGNQSPHRDLNLGLRAYEAGGHDHEVWSKNFKIYHTFAILEMYYKVQ
jgi:hypothetical protein